MEEDYDAYGRGRNGQSKRSGKRNSFRTIARLGFGEGSVGEGESTQPTLTLGGIDDNKRRMRKTPLRAEKNAQEKRDSRAKPGKETRIALFYRAIGSKRRIRAGMFASSPCRP